MFYSNNDSRIIPNIACYSDIFANDRRAPLTRKKIEKIF